jgi:hypothetical protein
LAIGAQAASLPHKRGQHTTVFIPFGGAKRHGALPCGRGSVRLFIFRDRDSLTVRLELAHILRVRVLDLRLRGPGVQKVVARHDTLDHGARRDIRHSAAQVSLLLQNEPISGLP